jgi:hypothetical protein
MIKPILLYGCEVWGMMQLDDKSPLEKVHIHFCKEILGIGKKSSNYGSRAELGRSPIFLKAKCLLFKYWLRLLSLPNDSLLKMAYILDYNSIDKKSYSHMVLVIFGSLNLK